MVTQKKTDNPMHQPKKGFTMACYGLLAYVWINNAQ